MGKLAINGARVFLLSVLFIMLYKYFMNNGGIGDLAYALFAGASFLLTFVNNAIKYIEDFTKKSENKEEWNQKSGKNSTQIQTKGSKVDIRNNR